MQQQEAKDMGVEQQTSVDPRGGQPIMSASVKNASSNQIDDRKIKFEDWGFEIERLFEVAYRFYKRNESKAFHPTFDERNHMNALILQARYGNFDNGRAPDVGFLDLIGKRRRHEWSLLKGMSKKEAMSEFICILDDICPLFKAHTEAVKISSETKEHSPEDRVDFGSNGHGSSHNPAKIGNQSSNFESNDQLQAIHSSLCRQTYSQFKSYAEKQCPNNLDQQKDLIRTLQEQYYQQYISKMHPELENNTNCNISLSSLPSPEISEYSSLTPISTITNGNQVNSDNNFPSEESNLQADISSEEINYEDLTPRLTVFKRDEQQQQQHPIVEQSSTTTLSQSHFNSETNKNLKLELSPSDQDGTHYEDQETCVEPVRLYQNIEPPIGPFESFPEPKLVKKQPLQTTPVELINPNLIDHKKDCKEAEQTNAIPPTTSDNVFITIPTYSSPDDSNFENENHLTEQPHGDNQPLSQSETNVLWNYSPPHQIIPQEPPEPATTWSKRGVADFKESLEDDKQGGVYEVKQSTQVYIQVPTYPDGKYIYFEFATDDYDIGFGLDFVYETNLIEPLALNIFEESDEEDEEFENDNWQSELADQNIDLQGSSPPAILKAEKLRRLSNTIQIIPTYRRDSHEEIFVGRHKYPGCGYYLLKFDNTYSVLRSKTLYFKICCFV